MKICFYLSFSGNDTKEKLKEKLANERIAMRSNKMQSKSKECLLRLTVEIARIRALQTNTNIISIDFGPFVSPCAWSKQDLFNFLCMCALFLCVCCFCCFHVFTFVPYFGSSKYEYFCARHFFRYALIHIRTIQL